MASDQGEKFDPWDIIAIPMWWLIIGAYAVRDFISGRLKSNTHLE